MKSVPFTQLNTLTSLQTGLIQAQGGVCQLNYEHSDLRLSSLGVLHTEGWAQAAPGATSHAPMNIWWFPPCLLCCLASPVHQYLKKTCWKPSAILPHQRHSPVITWPWKIGIYSHLLPPISAVQDGDLSTLVRNPVAISTLSLGAEILTSAALFLSFIITVDKLIQHDIYPLWQLKEREDDTNWPGLQRTNRAVCKKLRSGRQVGIAAVRHTSYTTNHDKSCQVNNFHFIEPPFRSILHNIFLNKIVHKFRLQWADASKVWPLGALGLF